jgi:hypothetical protein
MPPIFEFNCVCYGDKVIEALCKHSEKDMQECERCHQIMTPIVSAPRGKVSGSNTPVRQ